MKKKIAAALALGLGAAFCLPLAACGDKAGGGSKEYTVNVLDPSGAAYAGAQVRLSELGEIADAYGPVSSDEGGVAKFELPAAGETLDADLLTVPADWTYEPVTVNRGKSATIKLKEIAATEPSGGTGYGQYNVDVFGNSSTIDGQTFNPYVVGTGAYTFKLDTADAKIYLAFSAGRIGEFTAFSSGDADVNLTRLFGNPIGGIRKFGNEYFYDNISETDKNFRYAFNCGDSDMQGSGGTLYFELGLSEAADAGKEFTVTFKYERKHVVEPPKYTEEIITAKENFKEFAPPAGKKFITPMPLNDDFDEKLTPVLGKDGYYHKDTEDGPILYGLIKAPTQPYGLDVAFDGILDVEGGDMNFIFTDSRTYRYNYVPFISAYVEHANSDGAYPVTEELKTFLGLYFWDNVGLSLMTENLYLVFPEGNEWVSACGYYA